MISSKTAGEAEHFVLGELVYPPLPRLPHLVKKMYHFNVSGVNTVLDTMRDKSGDSSVRSLLNERNQGSQL